MFSPIQNNIYDQKHLRRNQRGRFNHPSVNKPPRNNIQRTLKNLQKSPTSITSLATKSAGNISQTLSNVQRVLNVVETATPIVQEYGPIVKNIPAIYRMMKAFNEIDDVEDTKENKSYEKLEVEKETTNHNNDIVEHQAKQRYSSKSIPKLYI